VVAAVVVLEVVHAPRREEVRVLLLVADGTGEAERVAGLEAGAGVDAELQALAVHVVRDRLDAVGEPHRVRHQVPGAVAVRQRPAVVEVDVGVAGVLEPLGDEQVGDAPDHLLVELGAAVGGVPVVEAHGRCLGEPVLDGRGPRGRRSGRGPDHGHQCQQQDDHSAHHGSTRHGEVPDP
jgi:hypothetical protein